MRDNAPVPPGQASVIWKIVCWVAVLLGASAGLIYFQYQFDWSESAGVVAGISRVAIFRTLGAVVLLALLALLALFWIINRQTRRRSDFHADRARRAESAVDRLLEEIRAACGKAPGVDTGAVDEVKNPIAQWQIDNALQAEEINRARREISAMADALGGINESASVATERAHHSAAAAGQGAAAVQNAIVAINDTCNRMQDATEQLKQLAQDTRRFDETINLIREVTEQTSVSSLNASLRGGLAGEAGVAEEMQRLADRAARGAGEITELARAIQRDADGVVAFMGTTAGEVAATGEALADEVGRALAEIESASREFLERIDLAASGAAAEAARAQTVGARMDKLKIAAEQAGANASRVATGIEKLRAAATDVAPRVAAFKPPELQ